MNASRNFPANAETMNALVDGMGATVMALALSMPQEQRIRFADNLAKLAQAAEKRGATTLETLLIDLHQAATL